MSSLNNAAVTTGLFMITDEAKELSKMKRIPRGSAVLATLMLLASATLARAAIIDGHCPFTDLTGTGTTSDSLNPSGSASAAWHDKILLGSGSVYWQYSAHGGAPLYYQETWGSTLKTIGTVVIDASERDFGGTIYAQTTPGGLYNTVIGSFTPYKKGVFIVNPSLTTMYGIKVELNTSSDTNWYEASEICLYKETFGNLAKGQTTVVAPGSAASLTDESYVTNFRSGAAGNYTVGFEFTDGQAHAVQALRYTGGSGSNVPNWIWSNPTVQIKQSGIWTDVGTVNFDSSLEQFRWIDFGSQLLVQGVRFSGAISGVPHDVFIDDIVATLPEPATLGLFSLGGLLILRRRR